MVTALNIANAILYKGFNEGVDLTPMKLQRLLYLTYKEFYKRTNTLLFDEKFEVWKYGPVVRSVNAAFKKYGSNCIKDYYREYNGTVLKASEDKSPTFKSILTYIWDKYKKIDGIPLANMSRSEKSAWFQVYTRKDAFLSIKDIKNEEDYL